jgi:NTE family protein
MSKLTADWEFLTHLRDAGREFASDWLDENFARIGMESTIGVHGRYL